MRLKRERRRPLDGPALAERRSSRASAPVLAGTTALLPLGPVWGFWGGADHAAAMITVVGVPAVVAGLIYAIRTDRRTEEISKRLSLGNADHLQPTNRLFDTEQAARPEAPPTAAAGQGARLESPPTPLDSEGPCVEALEPWLLATPDAPQDASTVPSALSRLALEAAIKASPSRTGVERLLREASVFVLGRPAGDTSVPGRGTESDILHFAVEDDGQEHTVMPAFTNRAALVEALRRNPEWQDQSVLQVSGGDLLDHRDSDVTLVVDPWTALELQIPP